MITIVEVFFSDKNFLTAEELPAIVRRIPHGSDDVKGRNIVAVIDGEIHDPTECRWCGDLKRRCQSRRKM